MATPDIPKRLAARIRAAQEKVLVARNKVIHYESRLWQDQERVREYDASPVAFAARYYKNNAVDSYPVQTNVSRCRESVQYRRDRIPLKLEELAEAEALLRAVEVEVLAELAGLKPSAGRVPWPRRLPSDAAFQQKRLSELDKTRRAHKRAQARIDQRRSRTG